MDHKQDSKKNTIKSRLLFAMVLMTCFQPIMCLDLSYYAARLGITRTPTRKELLMLGGGVLFTAAAMYFWKQRNKGGTTTGERTSVPEIRPLSTSSSSKPKELEKQVTMSDKVYTWKELLEMMRKDKQLQLAIKLLKILGAPQKKRVEAIIQQLDNIYEQTEWPDLWSNRGVYTDTKKVEIAIILDELDQLYEAEKVPNMPKFHEWLISLLNFHYSSIPTQYMVQLEDEPKGPTSIEYKVFIWCYSLKKEFTTIENRANRQNLSINFSNRVGRLLKILAQEGYCKQVSLLFSLITDTSFAPWVHTYINEYNIVLFVGILNVLYAVQKAPGIKDFYTTFFEKYSINRQNFLKLLASKNQEVHKALVAESTRINLQSNKDFFDWADRQRAISILERLIELTAPPPS